MSCALWGALLLGGCASQSNGAPAEPEMGAEPVTGEGDSTPAGSDSAEEPGDSGESAGADGEAGHSSGRLAFIECQEPRKKACTKEYHPVCGEVDTGIRCVTTPCPSTEQKQYGNACMACADEKVVGYFPIACDELTGGKAP